MNSGNISAIIILIFYIFYMTYNLFILRKITPVLFPDINDDIVMRWKSLKIKAYILAIITGFLAIAGIFNIPFMFHCAIVVMIIFFILITKVNLMQKKYKMKPPV